MNILGIGGPELILILLIMLIVAGPKRMIAWAYTLGKYIARFRRMWEETVDVLQKEFDEAGVDIKVPRELPTRANLNRQAGKALSSLTQPVQDVLDEVRGELAETKEAASATARKAAETTSGNGSAAASRTVSPPPPTAPSGGPRPRTDSFGTWSRSDDENGFGTWSAGGRDPQ
jgi:Sec-independent protein secretion pathway components